MKNVYKRVTILCCIILLFMGTGIHVASAKEENKEASFSIRATIPENQIDKNQTYFDLLMEPSQEQVLQITIKNSSDFAIVASTKIHTATTANNGSIVYAYKTNDDASLLYKVEDIAKMESEFVEIDALQEKTVNITLNMPKEEFDGVLLGAIIVSAEPKEQVNQDASDGVEIRNKIFYTLGLKLCENENSVKENMNYLKTTAETIDLSPKFVAYVQHDQASIMKNANIQASIYSEGKKNKLYETSYSDASFAPNSTFGIEIDSNGEKIKAGEYVLQMRIQQGDNIWEWDEQFSISEDDSSAVNATADVDNSIPTYILIIGGAVIFILLLILVFLLGRRSRKDVTKKTDA